MDVLCTRAPRTSSVLWRHERRRPWKDRYQKGWDIWGDYDRRADNCQTEDIHSHTAAMADKTEALDELEWRSPEWINVYGLRSDNILEYFSLSPFWDRQCNNQVLKMQRQFQANDGGNGANGMPPMMIIPTFDAELRRLRGIEYVVHMIKEPDLWVIRKQRRVGDGSTAFSKSSGPNAISTTMSLETYLAGGPGLGVPDDVVVLADFFCVGSKVYMASNVHAIVRQGVLSLSRALGAAADRLGRFTSHSGGAAGSAGAASVDASTDAEQWKREESLFLLAAQKGKKQ